MEYHFPIPVGNAFQLRLLMKLTDGTVVPSSKLTDVSVKYGDAYKYTEITATSDGTYLFVSFPATLAVGHYDIHVSATYESRSVAAHFMEMVNIVPWGECAPQDTIDVTWVALGISDAELDALKTEYGQKIVEAEQSKADYEHMTAEAFETIVGMMEDKWTATDTELREYYGLPSATESES